MKLKKSLITIITLVMLFSTSNSIYAINDNTNEVETSQEESQYNQETLQSDDEDTIDSGDDELESQDELSKTEDSDENLDNQNSSDEIIDKVPFYDENGQLYYEEVTDGKVDDPINPYLRSAFSDGSILVNFNLGGGTINYTNAITGEAGYIHGATGADGAYLGMSGNKVKFMIAGVIGLIPSDSVQLVSAKNYYESYYIVKSGKLYHYICTNVKNAPTSNTYLGVAPSYLTGDVKYYSYDGHYFYTNYDTMTSNYSAGNRNNSVNANNPYYSYFQYLPMRSTTNYTGSQLDSYIIKIKGSSTNSKMKSTGSSFINHQNTYGVNALIAFAHACNESAYGTSTIALQKNNLFGLNAVDSDPNGQANVFNSPDASIRSYMADWLSTGYFDATNWRYFGSHFGDKASGVNVKYASDQYGGEKVGSIALRVDEYLGGKDYNKYTVAVRDSIPNSATNASITSTYGGGSVLYQKGNTANYPVIVLRTVGNYYNIQSDSVLNASATAINSTGTVYSFTKDRGYISTSNFRIISDGSGQKIELTPSISYNTHLAELGWVGSVSDGAVGGATGKNLDMQAIQISLGTGTYSGGIQYRTYVENSGWQGFVSSGTSGTTGKGLRIEGIEINLTGNIASYYDVYYSTHVEDIGWLGWAKNGESSGTTGYSKAIEAIKITLVKKGGSAPGSTDKAYYTESPIYRTHVEDIGWQSKVSDGATAGTQSQSKRVEAFDMSINSYTHTGGITYRAHVQNVGWQSWVSNGATAGTTGKALAVEAIQVNLTGQMAQLYDVYYRTHVQEFGWLDWAKNGASAGSASYGYRVEAIQVKIVPKGGSAPGATKTPYQTRHLYYSAHVQDIGWQANTWNGSLSGTTGKAKRVEALRINLFDMGDVTGSVEYRTHVQNVGWQNWVSNGNLAGTSGRSLAVEALQIRLTGQVAQQYDIYYRAHVQEFGWLDWAKNGASAGTASYGYRVEGIEIRLVAKGGSAPGKTTTPYQTRHLYYSAHVQDIGWQANTWNGSLAGTTGKAKRVEAIKINLFDMNGVTGNVEYQAHVQNIGWQNWVSNGALAGTQNQSKRVEALKIRLTGNVANQYDIYYRLHVQDYGWLDWAKNGASAGTEGLAKRVEGIEIRLVPKGSSAPGKTTTPFRK